MTGNAARQPASGVQLEVKQVNQTKRMTLRSNTASSSMVLSSTLEESTKTEGREPVGELTETHWEIVDVCVRAAQLLGAPRSIGEIFGLIFCSPRPVSFDDVVRILKISNGSASYGLRYLKRVGAVQICYIAQERKDFYVAETSLRKMVSSALSENIIAHLGGSAERLERMRQSAMIESAQNSNVLYCIDQMIGWNQQLRRAVIKGFESLR